MPVPNTNMMVSSDSASRVASAEAEARHGTQTPAPCLDIDMSTIDPRLMEPDPFT